MNSLVDMSLLPLEVCVFETAASSVKRPWLMSKCDIDITFDWA
jgi:hypothetical protein